MALTSGVLSAARAREVIDMTSRLDQVKDVRQLTALLATVR